MADELLQPPVLLHVRAGEITTTSWVYAWLSSPSGRAVYVGATRLPPQVRTWLHLNDPDPTVGRVAARYPRAGEEDLDVLAFSLPSHLDRGAVRGAVITALRERDLLAAHYVGDAPGSSSVDDEVASVAERIAKAIAGHRLPA